MPACMSTLSIPTHHFDTPAHASETTLRLVPPPSEARPIDRSREDVLSPHMTYLLAAARRLTRNEADAHDLVQDTCVHALEALARMSALPDNVRGWLSVVMRNHWFSIVRHHRVHSNARAELARCGNVDSGLCESRVVQVQLERAWNKLTEQAQAIARQCLIDGDSYDDVSRRFGITAGSVACSIHRTREQLRLSMFGGRAS